MKKETGSGKKTKRISSYDYRAWDRFDVVCRIHECFIESLAHYLIYVSADAFAKFENDPLKTKIRGCSCTICL